MRPGLILFFILSATAWPCRDYVAHHPNPPLSKIAVSNGEGGNLIVASDTNGGLYRAFDGAKRVGLKIEPQGFLIPLASPAPGRSVTSLSAIYTGISGTAIPGFVATVQANKVYLVDPKNRVVPIWEPPQSEQVQAVSLTAKRHGESVSQLGAFIATDHAVHYVDIPVDLEAPLVDLAVREFRLPLETLLSGTVTHIAAVSTERLIYAVTERGSDVVSVYDWLNGKEILRGKTQMDLRSLGALIQASHTTLTVHGFVEREIKGKIEIVPSLQQWTSSRKEFREVSFPGYRLMPVSYAIASAKVQRLRGISGNYTEQFFERGAKNRFQRVTEIILSNGEIYGLQGTAVIQPTWTLLDVLPDTTLNGRLVGRLLAGNNAESEDQEATWISRLLRARHRLGEDRANQLARSWLLKQRLLSYFDTEGSGVPEAMKVWGPHNTSEHHVLFLMMLSEQSRREALQMDFPFRSQRDFPAELVPTHKMFHSHYQEGSSAEVHFGEIVAVQLHLRSDIARKYCHRISNQLGPSALWRDILLKLYQDHHPLWTSQSILEYQNTVNVPKGATE